MSKKRVNLVNVQLVKESSALYEGSVEKRAVLSPEDAVQLFRTFVQNPDREYFVVICLDTKNQPTNFSVVSIGSLNKSIVHPREIFKVAILSNSAKIITLHNHPSGDSTPSVQDKDITERLAEAGELLGIELIDHVIVGDEPYSMKRHGDF